MDIVELIGDGIAAAACLAAAEHERLRETLPFLPRRDASDYAPKLEWMAREGKLLGAREEGRLTAFLGGFIIDDFRNAGKGAFCPDWCHGAAPQGQDADEVRSVTAYRLLYRELARHWVERGIRIHSAAAYASDDAALEAFSLTGFGRIVMDAAVGAEELCSELDRELAAGRAPKTARGGLIVRPATTADAATLAELNARLASHIGASPVLMPRTHGADADEWETWLGEDDACALIAELDGKAVGYIKAEAPQFDVSDAVHGEKTLAINGLFVQVDSRRLGAATLLLDALAAEAVERGNEIVSVDCETTNIEAYGFWSRRFRPVTWSLERRV